MYSRRNYASPPLVEALCELHFVPGQEWDWTIPGLLYAQISSRFPNRQQEEAPEEHRKPSHRLRFASADGSMLIQIGPNVLVANCLAPYPGWETFRDLIQDVLAKYVEVAKPKAAALVILRYINKITVPGESAVLEHYLHAIPQVPEGVPESLAGWALSLDIPFPDADGIMLLKSGSVYEDKQGAFLLDLSFLSLNAAELGLGDALLNWIQSAHDQIETTFEASITDTARGLFQEELAHDQLSAC